ncbi:MAG: DUF2726 domain-containing protein [Planctomycetales bacterium]|nr:DUF2726 domain-containing protein [Planctomycetales bacterium]
MSTSSKSVAINCLPTGNNDMVCYHSRGHLLTEAEQRFYRTGLLPALAGRYHVSFKVRLMDVIGCDGSTRSAAFRKIQAKHLDFVLTTPKTARIIAAIELNDASHNHAHRKTRDAFVADALNSAGIPLLSFPIYSDYRPDVIRHHILSAIKSP